MLTIPRTSGILLHPTSLPGPGGLGAAARRFVDQLARASQAWWQILPLHPPGPSLSPYAAHSAFALDPGLVDLERLAGRGASAIDLDDAWVAWRAAGGLEERSWRVWRRSRAGWAEDWALYAALKESYDGAPWYDWPAALAARDPRAIKEAREHLRARIERHLFAQYALERQWSELRAYAAERGVRLIGDAPIFVARDSADVWARRELFAIEADGSSEFVAGVPPDYFSELGQKWGNPLYDWEACRAEGYAWWLERLSRLFDSVALARVDHFRAFQDYWATPAEEPDARSGHWEPGPRDEFFEAVRDRFGEVRLIAEDLGMITDDVRELRDRVGLPGMRVMQFGFGGEPDHIFLPHTYPEYCVGYTGTHDNDTTAGWYASIDEEERRRVRAYLGAPDEGVVPAMIAALWASPAALAIVPAQDLWSLGSEARMNTPATSDGNWSWRLTQEQLDDDSTWEALGALTREVGRAPATDNGATL